MTARDSRGRFTGGGGGGRKARGKLGRVTSKRGQQSRLVGGVKVRPLGGSRKGRGTNNRPGRVVGQHVVKLGARKGARAQSTVVRGGVHGRSGASLKGGKVSRGRAGKYRRK